MYVYVTSELYQAAMGAGKALPVDMVSPIIAIYRSRGAGRLHWRKLGGGVFTSCISVSDTHLYTDSEFVPLSHHSYSVNRFRPKAPIFKQHHLFLTMQVSTNAHTNNLYVYLFWRAHTTRFSESLPCFISRYVSISSWSNTSTPVHPFPNPQHLF